MGFGGIDKGDDLVMATQPPQCGAEVAQLFVSADLVVEEVSAGILVPKGAIQMFEGKSVVFVEEKDGFHPEPIEIGRANRTHVEILSGLPAGARYVAKGGFVLKAELMKESFGSGHAH